MWIPRIRLLLYVRLAGLRWNVPWAVDMMHRYYPSPVCSEHEQIVWHYTWTNTICTYLHSCINCTDFTTDLKICEPFYWMLSNRRAQIAWFYIISSIKYAYRNPKQASTTFFALWQHRPSAVPRGHKKLGTNKSIAAAVHVHIDGKVCKDCSLVRE